MSIAPDPHRSERDLTITGYQLRLAAFEGPLDVLLRLIERSQLAIEDLSLVAVTEQFLAFIGSLDETRPELIADFTAVGARLTVLKSRSLLPRPRAAEEEVDQSDLTIQLRQYQRLKRVAQHLGTIHDSGRSAFTADGGLARDQHGEATAERLKSYTPLALTESFLRRMSLVPKPAREIRQRTAVSLRDVVLRLAGTVTQFPGMTFARFSGLDRGASRTDVATAFLAVLVLVRRQELVVYQDDIFGDIDMTSSRDTGGLDNVNEAELLVD